MLTPLDKVLGALELQPWSVRSRVAIRRHDNRATVHRGGMQISVSELKDGLVAVTYEHAMHEVTRERLPPDAAARLLVALVQRERLCRVEVPSV
ncbi:MAG TPA: hypothetical protein VGY66_14710 [Gemmataceae bacterium]|jgi:hypothetical protein|nr:hypothetical protein [Gemmataceae bacterium]